MALQDRLIVSDDHARDHRRLLDAHWAKRTGRHGLTQTGRPRQGAVGPRVGGAAAAISRHRHAWHRHVGHVHVRRVCRALVAANGTAAQGHGDDSALQRDGGETAKNAHARRIVVWRAVEQSGFRRPACGSLSRSRCPSPRRVSFDASAQGAPSRRQSRHRESAPGDALVRHHLRPPGV